MTLLSPLTDRATALATYAGSYAWPPLLSFSRAAILNLLKQVQVGSLQITDTDGTLTVCGSPRRASAAPETEKSVYTTPHAELRVLNDLFWVRLAIFADMGFAESYMLGEVECPDLTAFFKVFITNRNYLANGSTLTSTLSGKIAGFVRSTNTLTNARLNISAHYDISNDMFAAFLSPDMTYSCPIWLPKTDPASSQETLEQAQHRKLTRFLTNAHIKSSDHVLEIGTGWGSFAILAVQQTGCRVTSLTLSAEQKLLAEQRIAAAGLSDRITVLLTDYRALTPGRTEREKFDKVVSIEMLEAVGAEYLDTYFRCIDRLLKSEGGVAVFQCITMPESRYEGYRTSDDFIRRYIFPGGHLPTVTQLLDAVRSGSTPSKKDGGGKEQQQPQPQQQQPRLIPESVENIGPHYAKTLRLWRQAFMQNFTSKIRPALLHDHSPSTTSSAAGKGEEDGSNDNNKTMSEDEIETFRRKWEYYFAYCEAGFATKTLGDVILTVGREGAVEMMEDVPL
ncbi:cyclopropane-fatty-acyl-phospholipid synthase [Hortaea werneckii]|nr:cyclopropane-fatty-acyl-phospholipid synthase [Hortaea werneckii]KAI7097119.1 cyclopropane-fatty-acyl-phospholipid synthase [Hortaea werneckii]KAI7208804.1 cyclopropane-fatty-acyl-phospholipid synthase [Hortaea werneckii]KAI7320341.1 cyclopropane-fatty-acyl-phospholipid synthase [Hortaea werneckii]KAI7394940.1 cyclopropane-fatty-acyl-phospholipid synthase [Hortaea werneckii]